MQSSVLDLDRSGVRGVWDASILVGFRFILNGISTLAIRAASGHAACHVARRLTYEAEKDQLGKLAAAKPNSIHERRLLSRYSILFRINSAHSARA